MGAGVYRIPNLLIESFCVYTNNIPCGHARSPGEPQMVFAGESHMDMIAAELGIDPAEFRRSNLLRDGDHLANGHHLEQVRARKRSTPRSKASRLVRSPSRARGSGRGVAMTHRHIGVGFTNARVRLETDGRVTLLIGLPDTGTGAHLTLRQVVAEVLGLAIDRGADRARDHRRLRDRFRRGRQPRHPRAGAPPITRAEKLQEMIAAEAAKLGVPGASLADDRAGRRARGPHAGGIALLRREVARARSPPSPRRWPRSPSDPATGQVTVRRFTTAHDVGTVINPIGHQGQIEGRAHPGAGLRADGGDADRGRPDQHAQAWASVKLPTVARTSRRSRPCCSRTRWDRGRSTPRRIGEGSISAVAPAIANAVADACGVRIIDLPITAEKVYFALKEKEWNRP